jgi:hypothetical protein
MELIGTGVFKAALKSVVSVGALAGALLVSRESKAVEGYFRIAPQNAPHKSFDLPGGGCPYYAGNSSGSLALYNYDNVCQSGDQQWYIHDTGGNRHTIRQGGPNGKCLDYDTGSGKLGTWDCHFGNNQIWAMDEMVNQCGPLGCDGLYGLWRIKSAYNGKVIDLDGGNTANGTMIHMWDDYANNPNQRWILWGGGGMHQDFADDFNGGSVDTGVWNIANFGAGRFNHELQYYTPSQVSEWGGHLTIVADDPGNCTWSGCYRSGRISSKWKRWYRNGMFSARIHYYEGNGGGGNMGTWPAFWFLGNNVNEDPVSAANIGGSCWPTSGARELDVWEWVRNNNGSTYINNGIQGSACQGAWNQATNTSSWNWGDWIIASVKIDGGRVKFYRGGVKTHDIPDAGFANEDFAFVFNLAVGGDLGGDTGGFNGGDWASIDVDWAAHETW